VTTGVLNYPRRPLTERERGIRETIDRIGDTHPPYIFVSVADAGTLQGVINSLVNGGTIWLEEGTYAAGDLTISNAHVTLMGSGWGTILTGSITVATGYVTLQDFMVRATGKAYGVKLYVSGGGPARCLLKKLWIGGSAFGAGDGPNKGLYLDGAILTHIDQCTMAFCEQSGCYIDSSSSTYTTNVNTFTDCTFNGNGHGGTGYGVELSTGGDGIAGMMLNTFHGGNMEDNMSGSVLADNNTGMVFHGIDFEDGNNTITRGVNWNTINISGSGPVLIEQCNFVTNSNIGNPIPAVANDPAGRIFLLTGASCPIVRGNRAEGYVPVVGADGGAIGVFSDTCVNPLCENNAIWISGAGFWFNNRGSMRGHR